MNYKSQKAHFATYTNGAQGITYTLSLNNDFDILVFDQQNNRISSLPIEVKAIRQLNGDTTDSTGSFELSITSRSTWTENTHYTFNKSSGTLIIKEAPTNFTEAAFQIKWIISDSSILTKTFTLKKQVSNVDYEIETDKSVINSTNLGGTVKVKIKKKDISGSKYLTNSDLTTDSLTLTSNQTLTWNSGGYWTFDYVKGQTEAVTITLKQNTLVWDTETVEFVLDGATGRSVQEVIEYYLLSDKSTGVTASDVTSTEIQSPTKSQKYLWNCEQVTYSDGTKDAKTTPVIIAYYTEDGRSVTSITNKYLVSSIGNIKKNDIGNYTWSSTPGATDPVNKYLWNYEIITYTNGDGTTATESTDPAIIGTHGDSGQAKKINTYHRVTLSENQIRTDYGKYGKYEPWWIEDETGIYNNEHIKKGDFVYLTGTTSDTNLPYSIYGIAGDIREDNNGEKKALYVTTEYYMMAGERGSTGKEPLVCIRPFTYRYEPNKQANSTNHQNDFNRTPEIGERFSTICEERYYTIFEVNWVSTAQATYKSLYEVDLLGPQGTPGTDGNGVEYVYYRSSQAVTNWTNNQPNNEGKNGWTNSPLGITVDKPYEYVSIRTKTVASGTTTATWSGFSTPIIWSKWGDKGQDGDGVEYEYYLSNSATAPTYNASDANWTDEPTGVSETKQYEYVVQIKTTTAADGKTTTTISGAALWAKWSKDGASPYTISLDEDFISVPTDASGEPIQTFTTTITPTIYYGNTDQKWTYGNNTLALTTTSANLTVTNPSSGKAQYTISGLTADRGTVTFTLKVQGETKATATFEAVKQKAGTPGGSIMVVHTGYAEEQAELERWVGAANVGSDWHWNNLVTSLGGTEVLPYANYSHLKKGDIITLSVKNKTTKEYNYFQARVEGVSDGRIVAQAISLVGPGEPGAPGTYVYAVSEPHALNTSDFKNITINMLQRVGSSNPTDYTTTVYYKYGYDGGTLSNGGAFTKNTTLSTSNFSKAEKFVQVNIYSDSNYQNIIDKLTISVVKNGQNGNPGNSVVQLYASSNTYVTPSQFTSSAWAEPKPSAPYVYACTATKVGDTYSNHSTPWLDTAQSPTGTAISPSQWAEFMTLTNGKKEENLFFNDNGDMYINASLINVGSLRVEKDFSVAINGDGSKANLLSSDQFILTAVKNYTQISPKQWLITKNGPWEGAYVSSSLLTVGKTYLLTYSFSIVSGTLRAIGGHSSGGTQLKCQIYYNGSPILNDTYFKNPDANYGAPFALQTSDSTPGIAYTVAFLFTYNGSTDNNNIYIQPNRGIPEEGTDFQYALWDIMLQEYSSTGNLPNLASDIIYTYPRGTAVTSDDVVTAINASADGVSILGNKINFNTSNFIIRDGNEIMFQAQGSGLQPKQIVTSVRSFGAKMVAETYGLTGRPENWTAILNQNSHINIGDLAYLNGYTNDANAVTVTVNGTDYSIAPNTYFEIYGTVTKLQNDQVTMTTTGLRMGSIDTLTLSTPVVQIAGWKVTKDSITIGQLGQADSFHMYSKGFETADGYDNPYFGYSGNNIWCLGIGKNFGVTKNGGMYCTSGEIGGWSISSEEIKSIDKVLIDSSTSLQGTWAYIATGMISPATNSSARYYKDSLTYHGTIGTYQTSKVAFFAGAKNEGSSSSSPGTFTPRDGKFVVLHDGSVYAQAIKLGDGALGEDDSVFLSTNDMTGKLIGVDALRTDWRLTVGSKFGITSDGTVYATGGSFTGDIVASSFESIPEPYMGNQCKAQLSSGGLKTDAYLNNTLTTYVLMNGMGVFLGHKDSSNLSRIFSLNGTGSFSGLWNFSSASWRGAKHDIEDLSNKYSILFDHLRSVRYKYNDETSGRYHIGFILDELKLAMDKANISTEEFAAYHISDEKTGDGRISYNEFISLCVYEIQKLKSRVTELEKLLQAKT